MMRRFPVLALLAAVAGCVAPPASTPPRQSPRPAPAPRLAPPPPPPAADWRDRPLTPGSWVYERDARGSRAVFGPSGSNAAMVLRCDLTERRIFLSRAGSATAPLAIRTSSATRALAVQPTGGSSPYVAAALAPSDPLLDALAFSRGKIVVEQSGASALVLPAWAEIGRVIEDCRG